MSNYFPNFNNLYGNLAQGAYPKQPVDFPIEVLDPMNQQRLQSGKSVPFDFSKGTTDKDGVFHPGGHFKREPNADPNLPQEGLVYLQPDPTLHTVKLHTSMTTPQVNGGYQQTTYTTGQYQKGMLTDEPAGFNAYFLTDTPKLSNHTKKTYFAVRGSDGEFDIKKWDNWNDWVGNNFPFAAWDGQVPQSKLALKGMQYSLAQMGKDAPGAMMDVTGHSLGTMVSVQAVALLGEDDFDKIDRLVLFNGPDPTASLKKMGISQKRIDDLSAKITYYVNPLDMVSMLNRDGDWGKQLGTVKVIVPGFFSTSLKNPSAHMFGHYQIGANGEPLTASDKFHPYLFATGNALAKLNKKALQQLVDAGLSLDTAVKVLEGDFDKLGDKFKKIYDAYIKDYDGLVTDAKVEAIKWSIRAIPDYQANIRSAGSSSEKISLRIELLSAATTLANIEVENQVLDIKKTLSKAKEEVQEKLANLETQAYSVTKFLNFFETQAILDELSLSDVWSEEVRDTDNQSAKKFQTQVEQFSMTLMNIANNIEEVDKAEAGKFETMLGDVQQNWGK